MPTEELPDPIQHSGELQVMVRAQEHPRMCWDNFWGWSKAGGGDRHSVWVLLRERNSFKTITRGDPRSWFGRVRR